MRATFRIVRYIKDYIYTSQMPDMYTFAAAMTQHLYSGAWPAVSHLRTENRDGQ